VSLDLDPRVLLYTAVSPLMELFYELFAFCSRSACAQGAVDAEHVGAMERSGTIAVLKEAIDSLVLMLSPFAPHMAEELWQALGHPDGIVAARWPEYDEAVAKAEEIVVPVQVNGKLRGRLTVPAETTEDELRELALADSQVRQHIAGREVKKVVVARGRLVSIVAP
jgi:leucyl-tRNA synthetase